LSKLAKKLARMHRVKPTPGSRARYIDARRQLQNNIRANQRECRANLCANITDMKSFSNYTKSLIGTKAPTIGMLEDPATGAETTTVEDVARVLLNQHFPGSVAPNPNPVNPNLRTAKPPQDIDLEAEDLKFINPTKLIEAFRLFGSHKSPGPDKFKPIVLQKLPMNALKVLCMLYKVSIALGYSPKRWTDSKVNFIPKPNKQKYTDANAFRPISLCSFILKGLERLVLFHLEETNLSSNPLCDAKHAFRRGKGCDTALSEAVDKIESGLLRQQSALGVFLDIKGAFNNMTFKSATNAMRKRGFPKHIIKWYSHFLHNQESTLELDNCKFTRKLVAGAPQGGVTSTLTKF
jgi:hypothetical protein